MDGFYTGAKTCWTAANITSVLCIGTLQSNSMHSATYWNCLQTKHENSLVFSWRAGLTFPFILFPIHVLQGETQSKLTIWYYIKQTFFLLHLPPLFILRTCHVSRLSSFFHNTVLVLDWRQSFMEYQVHIRSFFSVVLGCWYHYRRSKCIKMCLIFKNEWLTT